MQLQQVGEAGDGLAAAGTILVPGETVIGRQGSEVRFQFLVVAVDVAIGDIVDAEGLHGGDDHRRGVGHARSGDRLS